MEQANPGATSQGTPKKIISWILIIIAIAIVLLLVFMPSKQTSNYNPVLIKFENYSLYNGVLNDNYTITLDNGGYILMDVNQGQYVLQYKLKQCTNPVLSYTSTNPTTGDQITFNPLVEKVVLNPQGKFEKFNLSSAEQIDALTKEKLYVITTENTNPTFNTAILQDSILNFKADTESKVKFSYTAKCDDSKVTLMLFKVA